MRKALPILCFIMAACITFTSCSTQEKKTIPSQEAIDSIKSELSMYSKILPIEGGVGMIITKVDFDDASNTIKYKYQYTRRGVRKPSEEQITKAKAIAVDLIKQLPRDMKLLEQGFTFRYDYYSLDDEFLFSQEITPEDLPNK